MRGTLEGEVIVVGGRPHVVVRDEPVGVTDRLVHLRDVDSPDGPGLTDDELVGRPASLRLHPPLGGVFDERD
jgi:hypothetical protein